MEIIYTSLNFNELDVNLANIIAMNMFDSYEDDNDDCHFDYDCDDFYIELQATS